MTKSTRNLRLFFAATFIWTWAFYAPLVGFGVIACVQLARRAPEAIQTPQSGL
ncbi:MAG: hypothetical protein K8I30_23810 [Anaerolineae bacterium]|nr:hypothetical protein [Anaerolineae bacterium]